MKTKLLVLTAMSALLLAGCNSSSTGTLPAGGKAEDVTKEEGKETLKARLSSTQKAYEKLAYDAVTLEASSSFGLNAKASGKQGAIGEFTLNAGLSDLAGKATVVAQKDAEGKVAAQLSAQTTGGSLSLNGTIPGSKEGTTVKFSSKASLSGARVDAYLKGQNIYVDGSKNESVVKNVDTFANKLIEDLSKDEGYATLLSMMLSSFSFVSEGKLNFGGLYAKTNTKIYVESKPIDWPHFEEEEEDPTAAPVEEESEVDELVEQIVQLASKNVGFEFKTYKDNGYGFAFALNKEKLIELAKSEKAEQKDVDSIEKYVKKLELKADVYFNKEFLLESAGLSYNLQVNVDKDALGEDQKAQFEKLNVELSSKGSSSLNIKYGQGKVSYPSDLNEYTKQEGKKQPTLIG